MFGDKPIYLPFHPTDPCNAAARLARLELQFPAPANQRRHVPLFVSDAAGTPMSHAVVDTIFAAACLTDASDSEDDLASDTADGCLVAESGMCDKGAPLAPAEVKKGALVAVPFALGSHHVHYSGTISAVTSSTEVRVAFPGERPWLIARNRLFHVVSLDDTADDA